MTQDIILRKLEPACRMLAEVACAQEAKHVVDLARAAEVYARRQKLGEEAIQNANRVKIDAMALLGEYLKTAPKNNGAKGQLKGRNSSGGSKKEPPENAPPTLADLGIDKKESSDAQALAAIKDQEPDLFAQVRDGEKTVRKARGEQKKRNPFPKKSTPKKATKPYDVMDDVRQFIALRDRLEANWVTPEHKLIVRQFLQEIIDDLGLETEIAS